MFYKFDKNELVWKKNWKRLFYSIVIVTILILSSFIGGRYVKFQLLETFEKELIVLNVQAEKNKFTKEKFVEELKRLNIKHPHIVMAQSIIETGHWNSKIFKENHNLFGMKEARVRLNLAKGTQFGHAYYESWEESLTDYALWYSTYAYKCKTEKQLYKLLDKQYAEAAAYVSMLQEIVLINNLKEKFE